MPPSLYSLQMSNAVRTVRALPNTHTQSLFHTHTYTHRHIHIHISTQREGRGVGVVLGGGSGQSRLLISASLDAIMQSETPPGLTRADV